MSIKNALVVDDSMSARVMLRRMLEQKKVSVDLAETAEEALQYLRSKRPDVVFMDHILPGMNGFEATREIIGNPNTAKIPVIMYTSKEGDAYLEQARAHGAAGILRKPAKAVALGQILAELDRTTPTAGIAVPPIAPAAAAKPATAPAPPPPPAATPAVPVVEIEAVARRIVEVAVAEAVRTAVAALLEDKLGPLRQDLLTRNKNASKEVASEIFTARGLELSSQLKRYVNDQIADLRATMEASTGLDPGVVEEVKQAAMAAVAETAAEAATETAKSVARLSAQNVAEQAAGVVARQVANELFGTRSGEMMHQLQRHVHEQLGEIKTSIDHLKSLNPALAQEVKAVARATGSQAGAESAVKVAERAAAQKARTVAEEAGGFAGRRAAEEAVNTLRAEIGRVYVAVGVVLVLVVVAALLYFLLGV